MKPRIPPPIIWLLAAVLMWTLHRWMPLGQFIMSPWARLGLLPAAAGAGLIYAASARFRRAQTTINPLRPELASSLVMHGIYAITRNPMYLGLTLLLMAWALWLGTLSPWIAVVLFPIIITALQIIPEERALEALFGETYLDYRKRVARWIGRRRV
ncbi:MAG: isoprenylcysteine carboxylmethyltransferase family protein [Steroidobacteraceae bacterium]